MIFALPPPPPHPPSLPPAVIFAVRNRCNLPPCVLRVSSGEVMFSSSFFFSKPKLEKKKIPRSTFIVCTLQRRRRRRKRREGAKSINKTRHFRSVVNYVIFRIYTRKLDSTRRLVLFAIIPSS